MKTVTYDETKWQLVPVEPTEDMVVAGFESDAWDKLGDAVIDHGGWPYSCRESAACVTDTYKAMLSTAPTPPASIKWEDDALNWGGALNDAAWAFIEACPEKTTLLFNSAKASLRQAILVYGRKVGSNAISEDIDALRKDAERYRWLRLHFKFANDSMREIWFDGDVILDEPIELDDSIDEAMAAGAE